MTQMRELTLFAGIIPVKGVFLADIASTNEIEEPYRKCRHSLIVHFWPGKALVTGRWRWNNKNDDEALLEAVKGRELGETIPGQPGFKKTGQKSGKNKRYLGYRKLPESRKKIAENEHT